MKTLYFLRGSKHSERAKELVEKSGLEITVVDASSREMLHGLFVDFGIRVLPCLTGDYQRFIGLGKIENYLKNEEAIYPIKG